MLIYRKLRTLLIKAAKKLLGKQAKRFSRPKAEGPIQWPPVRPYPLIYFIEPTSICNAACVFCHYAPMKDAGKPVMNIKNVDFDRAIELMALDCRSRGISKIGASLTPTTGDLLINKNWANFARRVLSLDFVNWLDMVTNAILLNAENRNALVSLPNLEKINFSFSLGGLDRETYQKMFQTDKFELVRKNINELMKLLKEKDIRLNVQARLRVPEAAGITEEKINAVYNECGYKWLTFEILDTFKEVPVVIGERPADLKISEEWVPRDFKPCAMLGAGSMNIGADGNITGCGCHYSQDPKDKSLVLGNLKSTLREITQRRIEILDAWKTKNSIPNPCVGCQHYFREEGLPVHGWEISERQPNIGEAFTPASL